MVSSVKMSPDRTQMQLDNWAHHSARLFAIKASISGPCADA